MDVLSGPGPAEGRTVRRWPLWVGLGMVAALLLCSVPLVLTVNLLRDRSGGPPTGTSEPTPNPTPARSPLPGDPPAVTEAWLGARITALLDQQAAALLNGDEPGFLAVADPDTPAAADLKRQFRVLRAMRVTVWRPEIHDDPVRLKSGAEWRLLVTYQHCFVEPDCRTSPVTVGTRWADSDSKLRLVAVEPSMSVGDGPRPWEVSDLRVAVGERTLVATTAAYRSQLPELLRRAEQAALVADPYAVDGTPPERYRIFYAGPAEWKRWYGGGRPAWTAGYAIAVGGEHYEVVLNADVHRNLVDDLLRHELTHAASMPGQGATRPADWWLIEGIAEYAAAGGQPVSRYDGLDGLRRLDDAKVWNGRLDSLAPAKDAADWEVGGRYGVGYLAVRHLVDRFGEDQTLGFFKAVVHERRPVEEAAREAFGEEWSTLHDECVAYVRTAIG